MTDITSVEFDHCRELVMLPGSLFEFTSNFVQPDQLPSLLALYALHQTVSTIPDSPLDDSVKWAKLKWWHDEFNQDPASPSRHPVLRALWQSGVRARLGNQLLQQLIRDAILRVDAAPGSDEQAMFERFSTQGVSEIQLELALGGVEIDSEYLGYLAAATGTCRLISSFAPGQRPQTDRLPLSVMAKYGLSLAQIQDEKRPPELSLVLAQIADSGLVWFSKGITGLNETTALGRASGTCAHLQLRWAMERRRLQAVSKNAGSFVEKGKAFGPADAWFAWRFLRRLK